MDISLIIVNWNGKDFLRECLRSVRAEGARSDAPEMEVIVVDNASTDGSVLMVREEFPEAQLIENAANVGFAAGNNCGLRRCRGRYALLLNSDAQLQANALRALLTFMEAHADAGAAGAMLRYPDGRWQPSGRPFPTLHRFLAEVTGLYARAGGDAHLLRNVDPEQVREVDEVSGACLMVRRAAWEQVGLLDENFFLLYEDVDWCRRLKKSGWKIFYVPQARVVHHYGASRRAVSEPVHLAALQSAHYYFAKHHGRGAAALVKAVLVLREVIHFLLAALRRLAHRPGAAEQLRFRLRSLRCAWRLKSASI
ncbi:MAG: glycosyltransferase family 2 protein [Abditibacteriales bacterium]|nr:glycosyltransferase family 2 protein [Abditibacteriales bacterium]